MHENHGHDNVKRLETGLPYLLKHNRDHVEDLEKWIGRAQEADLNEIAEDLRGVRELSQEITRRFEAALRKLKHDQ